jgi:hypothetical protein
MTQDRYIFNLEKFEDFLENKQYKLKIALASELEHQEQIFMKKADNP